MRENIPTPESSEKPAMHEENLETIRRPISRRRFLKAAGLIFTGAATGISVPSIYEGAWNALEGEEAKKKIEELEKELSEKYGVRISVWKPHPEDRPTGVIKESLKERSLFRAYRSILELKNVLERYPLDLISNTISGIEIVHAVRPSNDGVVPEGATSEAMTSFGGNITIRAGYQSSMSYRAVFGEVLDANVLHHEIAHILTGELPKEEWEALHPNVQYVDNDWVKLRGNKPEGFALPYGAKSMDEDVATVAELLFADTQEVESMTVSDHILSKKIEYLKKWYEMKSNGEMNSDFWEKQAR